MGRLGGISESCPVIELQMTENRFYQPAKQKYEAAVELFIAQAASPLRYCTEADNAVGGFGAELVVPVDKVKAPKSQAPVDTR